MNWQTWARQVESRCQSSLEANGLGRRDRVAHFQPPRGDRCAQCHKATSLDKFERIDKSWKPLKKLFRVITYKEVVEIRRTSDPWCCEFQRRELWYWADLYNSTGLESPDSNFGSTNLSSPRILRDWRRLPAEPHQLGRSKFGRRLPTSPPRGSWPSDGRNGHQGAPICHFNTWRSQVLFLF